MVEKEKRKGFFSVFTCGVGAKAKKKIGMDNQTALQWIMMAEKR